MRARLAVQSSEIDVQLREIVLRDKALEFLACSPKGTVPVVVAQNELFEESLDVMHWALKRSDPEGLLKMPGLGYDWISHNDKEFKSALDHTKYSARYPHLDFNLERKKALRFLHDLDSLISDNTWMFGTNCSLADIAILPFVRQFANIDNDWFYSQDWKNLNRWLTTFLNSNRFISIMAKYDKWMPGDQIVPFPSKQKLFSS